MIWTVAYELQIGLFLPPLSVYSGGVERILKIVQHSASSRIHFTVYLSPGSVRNEEVLNRLEALGALDKLTIRREEARLRSSARERYDGLVIPSEFWTAALARARRARVRGTVHIEFQQLPYVGTFDFLKVRGYDTLRPLDIARSPLVSSRVLGDALPLSFFQLGACALSVNRAARLPDSRVMALTPVVRRNLEALDFDGDLFVPRVPVGIESSYVRRAKERSEERTYDGVYVGRFHPHKGFLDLPVIVAHLKKQIGEDVRVAVCGSLSFSRHWLRFQKLVDDLGVRKNLVMLGRVSREELYATIRRSSMLLYPSYVDSFSITILESLCLETPVLAYAIDALRMIWSRRKGVFLSRVGDPRAFAETYRRIREQGDRREPMVGLSAQSADLMGEYTWAATVSEERRFLEGRPSREAAPPSLEPDQLVAGQVR